MLRITRTQDRTLRLEGRLTRYEIGLLRETLRSAPDGPPVIDLADLGFLDPEGAAALAELRRRGAELRGGSAFVRELLKEESP
jgi:ABC-type transporter Mla MlaB component